MIRYLKLGRVHSSSVVVSSVLLGFILAGGYIFSPEGLLFIIFALLYHYVGFTSNDYYDVELDRSEKKDWKPLVNGEISMSAARKILIVGYPLVFIVGLLISRKPVAILLLLTAILFGHLYNYFKKHTISSPIYITIAFTSLFAFPYFATADTIEPFFIYCLLYAAMMLFYQIAYSGYYKDLEDPENLLIWLGAKVKDSKYIPNLTVKLFAYITKGIHILLGIYLWSVLSGTIEVLIPVIILYLGIIYFVYKQTQTQKIIRKKLLRNCTLIEVFSFYAFIFIVTNFLDMYEFLFLLIYPLGWFMIFNRIQWGSGWWLQPRV